MKSIHLTRKPLIGSVARNVLKWGVGGLNIGGSRIGSSQRHNPSASSKGGGISLHMSVTGMPEGVPGTDVEGRWPANVVFQHADGCCKVGKKTVADPFGEGDETVEVDSWECVEGCPLLELAVLEPKAPLFYLQFQERKVQ